MRAIYFTLLSILHFQSWCIWILAIDLNPVNISPESKRLSTVYLENMKSSVKPCSDFYDYVCHNWPKYNPRPLFYSLWHVDSAMEARAFLALKKYLEESLDRPIPDRSIAEAKALYKICMNTPSLERLDDSKLRKILMDKHKFPLIYPKSQQPAIDLPWKVDNRYIKLTGESAFFNYKIQFDFKNGYGFITQVNPLASAYGVLRRFSSWDADKGQDELQHYMRFLKAIIKKVAPNPHNLSWDLIEASLREVILFRERLRLATTSCEQRYVYAKIGVFQNEYNRLLLSREVASMDWLKQINALYKTADNSASPEITNENKFVVNDDYIEKLVNILGSTERRIVVNHIHLYFLERHINFDENMIECLEACVTNRIKKSGIIRIAHPKWKRCIVYSNLPIPLGQMYLHSSFTENKSKAVKDLLHHAKALLVKEILNSTWLDSGAKENSIKKLQNLGEVIGYPNWNSKPFPSPPNYQDSEMNPINVKAVYHPKVNTIYVSAANLQWPLYSPNLPYVIDYGATVSMLAHELYHTMDQIGITEKCPNGLYECWSTSMRAKFGLRTKCFEDQYKKFKEQEMKKYNLHLYGDFSPTLNEDLADVMGLKLAYKGYKERLLLNNGICPILPQFKKFTCDQLFFIAFANTNCNSATIVRRENNLIESNHNSFEVRVNGAVANMKEFSDAFHCKPNDPLNLKNRCDLWD